MRIPSSRPVFLPPQEATPFFWQTKGILTFAWQGELPLEKVRIYVGDIGNNFQLRAYQGGHLDDTGTLRSSKRSAPCPSTAW